MSVGRTLAWDWYPGTIPENVVIDETAYVETSFSFFLFRGELPGAVKYGRGATTYIGSMFDVGPKGVVTQNVPPFTVVAGNPARVIRELEGKENGERRMENGGREMEGGGQGIIV